MISYYRATCRKCVDFWYVSCVEEFGFIVPETEECSDCGGEIEIDTNDEYTPAERWADEREDD